MGMIIANDIEHVPMVSVCSYRKLKQSALCYLAGGLSVALCASGVWTQPVHAEGSRDMFPSGAPGNRGHIVWSTGTSAGFKNHTLFRVYANQGERILAGSSAVSVNNGNIRIYNPNRITGTVGNETLPNNANFICTSQAGRGFIASRAEELAGPESIDGTGNTSGYTPCFYEAPTTGIYYVAMYGPSGGNSNASANDGVEHNIEDINTGTNQNTGISAWDVTVRSSDLSSTNNFDGRLHTFFMNLNMGQNGVQLHSDIYPVTSDGYRYEIDMRGLDPFGFRLFGNQLGNLDSDGASPLYKDVIGDDGAISNPSGGTSSAPPQFPVFFNEADSAVLPFLPVYDPITGIETGTGFPLAPIFPVVNNPEFTGDVSGNTSTINTGGTFTFESNISGVYQIVISRDGVDFDPANAQNRVLRGLMATSGNQAISWNGRDNSGSPFPTGTFDYGIKIHGGEYHFPTSDAENNIFGGPTYTLLNATNPLGNNVAFYDHRGYYTVDGTLVPDRDPGDGDPIDDALCGNNPPSPPNTNLSIGTDSSADDFNVFGQAGNSGSNTNTRCTGSFGDTKTLDIWTYTPSDARGGQVVIIDPAVANTPSMLLVKRITAINRGLSEREQQFYTSYVDVAGDPNDNEPNWPGGTTPATIGSGTVESYIRGITGIDDMTAITDTKVRPGDEIEYTIPFLSSGYVAANDVLICDHIPQNTTFIADAFNNLASANTGSDRGIYLEFNGQQIGLTNTDDGDEIADTAGNDNGIGGYYFAPGILPSSVFPSINCGSGSTNETGAIVVDLSDIPNATGEGVPSNSYGFIRFKVVVD